MRRSNTRVSLLLALGLGLACERASTPAPSPEPAPTNAPDEAPVPEPTPAPEPVPAPEPLLDLPAVGGVHYLEVVTGGAEADAELPMIIALHGNGAYPALMAQVTLEQPGSKKRPARPYDAPARFIFLRGTEPVGAPGHARWFKIKAADALASPAKLAKLAVEIEARSHTVAAAIEMLVELRPTKGKPIITGHSQGAILAFGLAILHPELFAAAFPVAGWLPPPLWPTEPANAADKQLRIVALHGAQDTVVDFRRSREAITALEALGWSVSLRTYPGVKHTFNPMLAELRELLRGAS